MKYLTTKGSLHLVKIVATLTSRPFYSQADSRFSKLTHVCKMVKFCGLNRIHCSVVIFELNAYQIF